MKLVIEMEVGMTKARYSYTSIFSLLRSALSWSNAARTSLSVVAGDYGNFEDYDGTHIATWRVES